MNKKITVSGNHNNLSQNNPEMDNAVEEFIAWFVKGGLRTAEKIPFLINMNIAEPDKTITMIGEENINKYLQEKKSKLGKSLASIKREIIDRKEDKNIE